MKLSIGDNGVTLSGEMRVGTGEESLPGQVSVRFDEIQEALDFARGNHIALGNDPVMVGYSVGGLAVQISEGKMDEALIHQAIVFSTDAAWVDALRKLAEVINNAADELERG